MKIATRLLFALTILGGCSAMSAKPPRLKSPKSAFGHGSKRKEMRKTQDLRKQSYMLLHSLADLDLGTALTENVGSKIVTVATKVANLTAASTHDDFAKLLPASGENDFTKLVAEYSLFDRGAFRYLVRPKRQLKDLQILVKEVAQASSNGDQPVKEFQDLQELWSVISKKFDAATQKAFLQSTTDALEILVKAYAARAAEAVKSKPHATDAQKKLLTDSTEILKESNSAASAFNDSVMIELGVKDPESANTMLKPMYEAIPDIAFLGRALMQWPEAFATPKESLELLHLAQCAYQINNRIQGVVTKMRNRTLFRARRSLREVSFHLTQLQETLNEVTDNVGPFKKASGDLVSAAEPVIQDLEALKKSITTLIKKLSEETKAQGHSPATSSAPTPAAPAPTIPAPTPAPVTPPAPAPVPPVPSPEHAPAPVPTPGV